MKKFIPSIIVFIFLAGVSVTFVHAQNIDGECINVDARFGTPGDRNACEAVGGTWRIPTNPPTNPPPPGGSNSINAGAKIDNPFKGGGDLYQLFQAIINDIVLPIGGVLAVLAFIYSGFMYVIAQGEPKKLEIAHKSLLYTAIGTAILLGSWIIANVLENTINALQSS